MDQPRILPHGDLVEIVPGLWQVRGTLPLPLPVCRNMTIVRLGSDELLLHSVVALDEAGCRALEALGRPAVAIVPHAHHQMDAPFFKARYRDLRMLCPAAHRAAIAQNVTIDATLEEALPALGIEPRRVPGIRFVEYALVVPVAGGRAVIVNDALTGANPGNPDRLLGRLARFAGAPGNRLGIARFFRLLHTVDIGALRAFAGELAKVPDLRAVAVSHGDAVAVDPVAALERIAQD